jgi:hypothetical protein
LAVSTVTPRYPRGPADDRLLDDRGGEDLAVEHDGKAPVDVFGGQLGELGTARLIESDRHDRCVGAVIETLLGIGQLIALDPAQPLERERNGAVLGRIGEGHQFVTRGHDPLLEIGRKRRVVDQLEFKFRGLPEKVLERGGILETGHLHHDAVGALADNRRLARAQRVDALADNFGRGIHRLAHRLIDPGLGGCQNDAGFIDDVEIPVALAGQLRPAGQRLQQFADLIDLGLVGNQETDRAIGR